MSTQAGTLFYMAPEMLKGQKYTDKVDSWALGIVILEIWLGRRAPTFENRLPALGHQFPRIQDLNAIKNDELREIAKDFLIKDADKRKSIIDIFNKK